MTEIQTGDLTRSSIASLDEPTVHQIYCGLDTCVTFEVFEALGAILSSRQAEPSSEPEWPLLYSFERALQAPALDMMLRGFAIDGYERAKGIAQLSADVLVLEAQLNELAHVVWGKNLNPRSRKQLLEFFNTAMRLPETWTSKKGERKLSMDREALEKLDLYFHARPIVALVLETRTLAKQLNVLETEISHDGRMRTSYNIGGTNTGRWSSSSDVNGTGTNLQNIDPKLRRMFIADEGWKLCGIDLEQAESREVGWLCGTLFNDWGYLDACEGGDLHTTTARLIWPSLGWTGSAKEDRKLADQIFYREFSYRDMSKRGGHATNYLGTPFTIARHLKVPTKLIEDFQLPYFTAFPGIPRWHQWTAERLQRGGVLTTPFGRSRQFFGRSDDDATLRKAIAFSPQSSTGDRLNLGLWRIWKYMPEVQLLAQVHDAVYFQLPDRSPAYESAVVQKALGLIEIELQHAGRSFVIPGEAKVGYNWGLYNAEMNPDGLKKWTPNAPDTRGRASNGKDRVL